MNDILVSIITVVRNGEKTIRQTIESVINQSFHHIEYIVIDGGSTDNTIRIINEYRENIDCLISEPDNGIYDAMNKGIALAHGDLIGIINSDDWYDLDAVKHIVEAYINHKSDILYGEFYIEKNDAIYKAKTGSENELWYWNSLMQCSSFVCKDLYERIGGYDTKWQLSADYEFFLRAYTKGSVFYHIDSVISTFRMGGVSTREKRLQTAIEARQIQFMYFPSCPQKDIVMTKIIRYYRNEVWEAVCSDYDMEIYALISDIISDNRDNVFLFGCGTTGKEILKILSDVGYRINAFIDNDPLKQGKLFNGVSIRKPEVIVGENACVIICCNNLNEVKKQIFAINDKCTNIVWYVSIVNAVNEFLKRITLDAESNDWNKLICGK